jgi:plasmid stabilization system protein ParE
VARARIERHRAVIEKDLPDLHSFIAQHDRGAAERLLDAIEVTFNQLTRHPDSGALYSTRNPRLRALRMLPVTGFHDYLIFYRLEKDDVVRILYVTHGARHLIRLFRRESRT